MKVECHFITLFCSKIELLDSYLSPPVQFVKKSHGNQIGAKWQLGLVRPSSLTKKSKQFCTFKEKLKKASRQQVLHHDIQTLEVLPTE